jgi:hypothetical protein
MILLVLVFALISATFGKTASNKGRNKTAWIAIGIASYFGAQLIAGMLIAIDSPDKLTNIDFGSEVAIGLVSGGIGLMIAYIVLWQLPDLFDNNGHDSNVLDNNFDHFR